MISSTLHECRTKKAPGARYMWLGVSESFISIVGCISPPRVVFSRPPPTLFRPDNPYSSDNLPVYFPQLFLFLHVFASFG